MILKVFQVGGGKEIQRTFFRQRPTSWREAFYH